jgi:hypothetical protein
MRVHPAAVVWVAVVIRLAEQVLGLILGLLVIERLLVRQRIRRLEDVDGPGHVGVQEADGFVVAGLRELNREGVPFHERRRRYARRAVERRGTGRKRRRSAAALIEIDRPDLRRRHERDRVELVHRRAKRDAVVLVDPDVVRQKCEGLPAQVLALRADLHVPRDVGPPGR